MTTETKPIKAPRKRRSISTHRLYKEVNQFMTDHNLKDGDQIGGLLDALKEQVLDDLDMS